jgi:hypothetical protein
MGLLDRIKQRTGAGLDPARTHRPLPPPSGSANLPPPPAAASPAAPPPAPGADPGLWPWRQPLPAGAVPVATDSRRAEVCLLDPATLEPLRYLEENEEEELGVVRIPVAGTGHRLKEASSSEFRPGTPVQLVPEPKNRYDRNAVQVRSATSRKVAGYVPAPKSGNRNVQQAVQRLLAQGPVQAVVLESAVEQGPNGQWVSMRVAATNGRFVFVDRPWDGPALKELKTAALEVEGTRWPEARRKLRRDVTSAASPVDRHYALQALAQAAYRLRAVHPDALEDAEAACREQILLADVVGPALRQEFGSKPSHHGYKQLSIILEKQKRDAEALDVVERARSAGWDGDWDKRVERLAKKV